MRIYEDLRVVQGRLSLVQYFVLSLIGVLLVVFWHLQVLRGKYYRTLAENNRTRAVSIAAPRGAFLDRTGRILVENRASFNVVLTPEHSEDLDAAVARLGRLLRIGEAQIRERLARRGTPFRPVIVKTDVSTEDVAVVEARRLELPETTIEVVPIRSYPLASAAAHTLGRVGEITDRQLQSTEFEGLQAGDLVGQAGIESQYNHDLMGTDGLRRVIVNSRGLEVGEAERHSPLGGPNLMLTLDSELQSAMEQAFQGRAGSAVALDPDTGEILAMTSTPAYDPNEFTTWLDPVLWNRLSTAPDTPLMNRVIQGQYAPGSLFKIIMATAALEEGVVTPSTSFYCPGYLSIYDNVFRCNRAAGHGMVSLHRAIEQSCNVYFYQVGVKLEIERIAAYAKRMGLGAPTGVDLPHETSGLVPNAEWKLRTQKVPWYAGETVSVAIGQGQLTATPLQMARVAAVVANGGRLVHPHLVKAVGGRLLNWDEPTALGFKPETLAAIKGGMCAVVNEQGTGWRARLTDVQVCGKTGSAQVVTHARLMRGTPTTAMLPHGWFVAFAPSEKPRVALAVIVEHGNSGGESAAPVAREILAHFFGAKSPALAVAAGGVLDEDR